MAERASARYPSMVVRLQHHRAAGLLDHQQRAPAAFALGPLHDVDRVVDADAERDEAP